MNARTTAIATRNAEIDASQQRAIAAREAKPRTALEALASRLQLNPTVLTKTLRQTAFSACKTDEEFVALVVVANAYGLDPLLKEIYAFPAKGGGIVPMVSIDGWIRIMNEHPQFDGVEFDHIVNEKGNLEAIEAVFYRKDRSRPVKVIEYLEENKRGTEPWKMMPNRMLRHRALIQGARIAFGFSGVASEGDEEVETYRADPRPVQALPDTRTLGEQIGDEIPAFDGETGEIEAEAQAEAEPERDAQGMTVVDEESARELDAQQDGETQDEAEPDSTDELPAWHGTIEKLKTDIDAAADLPALKKLDTEYAKHRAALPDDVAEMMDGRFTTMRDALKRKAEG